MLNTDHLRRREQEIATHLKRLSDRELADLLLTLQTRPTLSRRDARHTATYIRLARQEIQRRRSDA